MVVGTDTKKAADRLSGRQLDTLFNSPCEVEASPYASGRSPDLRFNEAERPSQGICPSGFDPDCQTLNAYSYAVATDLHRLPEHQMKQL
jgi:hypothetical protein